MWRFRKFIVTSLLCCLIIGSYQAQETNEPSPQRVFNVAFIEDGRSGLNSATTSNVGDDGITRLRDRFISFGANVESIDLDAEINEQYELVVLISPKRALSTRQSAYLWQFLQRGGHLLLAIDPNGHNGTNSERFNSSISQLLYAEYGISIMDDLWIEPWFSVENLSDVVDSWSEISAENLVHHPITEPLLTYDLPIRFWGGRSVLVDGFTGISNTNALIYSESIYGETGRVNFRNTEQEQLFLNIGNDNQGRLLLGAVAENRETGSRVALLGDGEILQNLYGQAQLGNGSVPRYPGNYIFTQRLIAWLLGIPEAEWPSLPDGFTWLALDGKIADWPVEIPVTANSNFGAEFNGYDILNVRALHNDQFLYISIETLASIPDDAEFTLQVTLNGTPVDFLLSNGSVSLVADSGLQAIDDAAYTISDNAEIRLPLRVVGTSPLINSICMLSQSEVLMECIYAEISSTQVNTIDPVAVRFPSEPGVMTINAVNLRAGPGTNNRIIEQMPIRSLFSVVGRIENGEWLLLRNGRHEGWMAEFLLRTNIEIESLPVVSP